jgi:hypothetical protein
VGPSCQREKEGRREVRRWAGWAGGRASWAVQEGGKEGRKAGWARPRGRKRKEEKENGPGQEEKKREGEKEMHSNAFELNLKFKFK